MIVVFLGPPGCGKGTQAKRLESSRNWPQVSTGDMLRAAVQQGTRLGNEAKAYMDRGELVPDAVVIGLLEERISRPDCKAGLVLDGFPRTDVQARALDGELKRMGKSVDRAVYFEIPNRQLVERLSGRRTCSKCGTMYHVIGNPSKKNGFCDRCDGPLVQRDDDREEVIMNRLEVYSRQTAPLIQFYSDRGILHRVDATRNVSQVESAIQGIL